MARIFTGKRIRQIITGSLVGSVTLAVLLTVAGPVLAAERAAAVPLLAGQDDGDWHCAEVNGTTVLNVRSGPGLGYATVDSLAAGTRLEADFGHKQQGPSYDWVPVRFGENQGWVISPRLDACPDEPARESVPAATPVPVPTAPPGEPSVPSLEGVNQDGTLDRFEIAIVARSVVLLANIRRTSIDSTGTGTIISPDGLIITNAHVVEQADRIAVALLDDINDPPEYRYLAEVVSLDSASDVALLAVRTDTNGRPVAADSLDLPYMPALLGADEVYRGDQVYIFGFPGIGDDYLVVTSGTIVSVENGMMSGRRVPVWYRTDAEIAPGSSGGLVVNGDGAFVGIPTFVRSESETGGRLGGIRPAEVALMAVNADLSMSAADLPVGQPESAGDDALALRLKSARLDHGVVQDGEPGIMFHLAFVLNGWAERNAVITLRFFHDDMASTPLVNPQAPKDYRDKDDRVVTQVVVTPCCDETIFDDLPVFVPYIALGIVEPGTHALTCQIEVAAADDSWRRPLTWEFITFTLE